MTKKSTTQKKVGALSLEDMQYIRDNAQSLPPAVIAFNLNRNLPPVLKYMRDACLLSPSATDAEQDAAVIRKSLMKEPWWDNVAAQCDSKEEKELFIALWVQILHQLNNEITSTEKLQVKDMVFTEIFANRSQAERASHVRQIDEFKTEVAELQREDPISDESQQKIMYLSERISYLRNSLDTFAQSHLKLSESKNKALRELKVSREQRKKNIEESSTSFGGYIKSLLDEKRRKEEGFDIEAMKLAKDKVYKKLSQFHTYADGVVDRPILNCDTIEEDNGQEEDAQN